MEIRKELCDYCEDLHTFYKMSEFEMNVITETIVKSIIYYNKNINEIAD